MSRSPISFVIAAYNDQAGVARHLNYFSNYPDFAEVIIIDDASDDDLDGTIKAANLPSRIELRYHRNTDNLGPGPSRNIGLEMARRDRIMFVDADDLLVPEFADYIALSPLGRGADFVFFKYHLCNTHQNALTYNMHSSDNSFFTSALECGFQDVLYDITQLPSILRTVNFPWNKVFLTEFLHRADITFPDLRMHEDIQPHWRSCLRAKRFAILDWAPPLISHYEVPNGSRATNYIGPKRKQAFQALCDVYEDMRYHPFAASFVPELLHFSQGLLEWMVMRAPTLSQELTDAAEALYQKVGARPEDVTPSLMGHVLD